MVFRCWQVNVDSWSTYRAASTRTTLARAIGLCTSTPINRSISETEIEWKIFRCTGSVKKWGLLRESRLSTDWRAQPSACGHPRSSLYYRMVSVCIPARHFDISIYPPVHGCRIYDHNHARTREIDKETLRFAHLWNSTFFWNFRAI